MVDNWKKELAALIRKHRLLPENFTGRIIITMNQGGVQNALRASESQPLKPAAIV
jgi:hypothetical protein